MEDLVKASKMRVKIVKCHSPKAWYFDKVGEIFEIDEVTVRDFYIKTSYSSTKCILRIDAIELD
jgi:hypothetical protein